MAARRAAAGQAGRRRRRSQAVARAEAAISAPRLPRPRRRRLARTRPAPCATCGSPPSTAGGRRRTRARQPAARGAPPGARAGPGGLRAVRRHRRPGPPQGRPGALPAVADQPAARTSSRIVAVGRRPYTDDDVPRPSSSSRSTCTRASCPSTPTTWADLAGRIVYQQGDFDDPAGFDRRWPSAWTSMDAERGTRGNRIFYLATQPSAFAEIVAQLGRVGPRPRAPRRRLAAGRHREAVRARPRLARSASTARSGKVFRESAGLPHRPLPGQGDGPEPAGLPVRQRHLRADLEPPATSTTCRSRWPSRSASRTAARSTRRPAPARLPPEPPAAAADRWSRWSRRPTFEADALRDEKVKVLRAVSRR